MLDKLAILGDYLTDLGLEADPDEVNAIQQFPKPDNRRQLQRFLGMVNYIRQFCPELAAAAATLSELQGYTKQWKWTDLHSHSCISNEFLAPGRLCGGARVPYDLHVLPWLLFRPVDLLLSSSPFQPVYPPLVPSASAAALLRPSIIPSPVVYLLPLLLRHTFCPLCCVNTIVLISLISLLFRYTMTLFLISCRHLSIVSYLFLLWLYSLLRASYLRT